ncbi:MAG TPA: hypothetical protein VFQ02_07665, partial [Nitrospira sp.]|nr:hypothetical protein [Nitrospira sp.]
TLSTIQSFAARVCHDRNPPVATDVCGTSGLTRGRRPAVILPNHPPESQQVREPTGDFRLLLMHFF